LHVSINAIKPLLHKAIQWLLPMRCLLCSTKTDEPVALCARCASDLSYLENPCLRCAAQLPTPVTPALCGACSKQPPPFSVTLAPFDYASPIDYLITQLKFSNNLAAANVLAQLLLPYLQQYYQNNPPWPQVIIPVPLHRRRMYTRGFNQAVEICKPIAKHEHCMMDTALCQRVKNTTAQSSLPANQREANIKNAFHITTPYPYQHVAILDDVITTGNTVTTLAKELKNAGVMRIDVWASARAQVN
jgi:ComF family protein